MELTKEQMEYIMNHQRSPENAYKVSETLRKLAERYPDKDELQVMPEELKNILLIANIGEHHPDMYIDEVSIYSKEFGKWDDSDRGKKAKDLNAQRGSKSVEMAQQLGIKLEPEMVEAIEASSQGKSVNLMSVLMKAAQTYEVVKSPRWSRGEKKEPAKNFEEVEEILKEELDFMMKGQEIESEAKEQLISGIIESARATYSVEKVTEQAKGMVWDTIKYMQSFNGEEVGVIPMETDEFWNDFFSNLTNEQVTQVMAEVESVGNIQDGMVGADYHLSAWYNGLESMVNKYKNPVKTAILEATSDISQEQILGIMDEMNPDKDKQEQH